MFKKVRILYRNNWNMFSNKIVKLKLQKINMNIFMKNLKDQNYNENWKY